jgi:hypothetical protein
LIEEEVRQEKLIVKMLILAIAFTAIVSGTSEIFARSPQYHSTRVGGKVVIEMLVRAHVSAAGAKGAA